MFINFKEWLFSLFGFKQRETDDTFEEVSTDELTTDSIESVCVDWNDHDKWTLKKFLNSLDDSFDWLEKGFWNTSWLDKDSEAIIKHAAPYVLTGKQWLQSGSYRYSNYGFPSFNVVAFNFDNSEDIFGPKGGFAIRHARLPWEYESINGVPYLVGTIINCNKSKTGKKHSNFCVCGFVVVTATGEIKVPRKHYYREHSVNSNGRYRGSYSVKKYGDQDLVRFIQEDNKNMGRETNATDQVKELVAIIMNSAIERDFNWSILVKKNSRMVSYSIPNENIKYFFRDRLKLRTTPTGKRKPIIHYVKSHKRKNGANVKTHIRGERMFYWNKYQCSVFAPGWHGKGITEFQVGGTDTEDMTPTEKKKSITSATAVKRITNHLFSGDRVR